MLGASNPLGEPQSREEALLMQLLEKIKPEDFIVTLTYSSGSYTYTADKTYEQISAAISSGKNVYLVDGKNIANLVGILDDENIDPTHSYISFKTSCGMFLVVTIL